MAGIQYSKFDVDDKVLYDNNIWTVQDHGEQLGESTNLYHVLERGKRYKKFATVRSDKLELYE
jgi:hypothetical protein